MVGYTFSWLAGLTLQDLQEVRNISSIPVKIVNFADFITLRKRERKLSGGLKSCGNGLKIVTWRSYSSQLPVQLEFKLSRMILMLSLIAQQYQKACENLAISQTI